MKAQMTPTGGSPQTVIEVTQVSFGKPAAGLLDLPAVCTVATSQGVGSSAAPNFAGQWELFEMTWNGQPRSIQKPLQISVTQTGNQVHVANRVLTIDSDGKVSYQTFAAHDDKAGHAVATEAEADLVDTFRYSASGPNLILELTFDYRHPYNNHDIGKDIRVDKYRRVQ
jgi:hypothetical protein